MKKLSWLVFACMSLCMAFSSGCTPKEDEKQAQDKYPNVLPNEYVLYDFEEHAPDYELIRVSDYFGSIDKSKEHVKSGNCSAKVKPLGSRNSTLKPYFVVSTISDRFGYYYYDFRNVRAVKISVYNAEDTTVNLEVGLQLIDNKGKEQLSPYFGMYELQAGWNAIEYEMWDGAALSQVEGIFFRFDNYAVKGLKAPTLYMDDFTIVSEKNIYREQVTHPLAEDEFYFLRDYASLNDFDFSHPDYHPEWVAESTLKSMEGGYTGKAIKVSAPAGVHSILVKPRLTELEFREKVAEGYNKMYFWYALDAEKDIPVKLLSDNTVYGGSTVEMEKGKWYKLTVDITEAVIKALYSRSTGLSGIFGSYVSKNDRVTADGSTVVITMYAGDIGLIKG